MMNEHATKRRFDGPHGDLVIIGKQLIHIWQKGCWRYSLLARNCGSHGTTSVILVGTLRACLPDRNGLTHIMWRLNCRNNGRQSSCVVCRKATCLMPRAVGLAARPGGLRVL
jgi:hypothetical protein